MRWITPETAPDLIRLFSLGGRAELVRLVRVIRSFTAFADERLSPRAFEPYY